MSWIIWNESEGRYLAKYKAEAKTIEIVWAAKTPKFKTGKPHPAPLKFSTQEDAENFLGGMGGVREKNFPEAKVTAWE